jgi:hypothetical protein
VKRAHFVAVLAVFPILEACGAVQTHPLSVSANDGRALFPSIETCAAERKLEAVKHPDSVNVRAVPGAWAQFMAQGPRFNLVVAVEDQSGGPQAMQERAASAKKVGDEIFACALAAGPKPGTTTAPAGAEPTAGGATAAMGAGAPATTDATAATPAEAPPPAAAGATATATVSANGQAATPAAGPKPAGGKNPFDGFGQALGGALGAMTDCTKLATCRTRLSGELCLGMDKSCLDAINSGDQGGPAECGKNLARVRTAAERFKKRPDWKMPDECK